MRALIVVATLTVIQSAPAPPPAGVLVGVHRAIDFEMQPVKDRKPPTGGELRTIWMTVQGGGSIAPVEIPDLLLPRRSGFWRVGLLDTCVERPHLDADDKPNGVETTVGDQLWAVPLGRTPEVHVDRTDEDIPVRLGPCTSTDMRCDVDKRIQIHWIWPEYFSLDPGTESACGAHPDATFEYTVQRPEALGTELTIADVLGEAVEQRFRAAYEAEPKPADCEAPHYQPSRWHIERVPGGWKAEGWSDTHRLCGYGIDYSVDVDLSRVTGRPDDRARWPPLKAQMPQLSDAHFSPDGRWIVAATEREVLLLDSAAPAHPLARAPLSDGDDIVMVEWATGANVARWNAEVRRARSQGPVKPRVVRIP